jgi:hypothetical protein
MFELKILNIRSSCRQGNTQWSYNITVDTKSCIISGLTAKSGERGDSRDVIFTHFFVCKSEALRFEIQVSQTMCQGAVYNDMLESKGLSVLNNDP